MQRSSEDFFRKGPCSVHPLSPVFKGLITKNTLFRLGTCIKILEKHLINIFRTIYILNFQQYNKISFKPGFFKLVLQYFAEKRLKYDECSNQCSCILFLHVVQYHHRMNETRASNVQLVQNRHRTMQNDPKVLLIFIQ